jgi:hypothetical protein
MDSTRHFLMKPFYSCYLLRYYREHQPRQAVIEKIIQAAFTSSRDFMKSRMAS